MKQRQRLSTFQTTALDKIYLGNNPYIGGKAPNFAKTMGKLNHKRLICFNKILNKYCLTQMGLAECQKRERHLMITKNNPDDGGY